MNKPKHMVLGAYISYGTGHHPAAWRDERVAADGAQNIDRYVEFAQEAEKGLFDFIFLSDTPSVFRDDLNGYGSRVVVFEPLTLLSSLAMVTTNIGLVATASTTYKPPYDIAREFASLDLISKGRAAWNLVTSSKSDAAFNYGLEQHPEHAIRYQKATEAFKVITGLWDSWDDDAFLRDKSSGIFFKKSGMHELKHEGEFFSVRGPLNISRPPQGYPIIVQAGSSEPGMDLAAKTAEVVFTAQTDISLAQDFYSRLKNRLANVDRLNKDILIMPGICPFTAKTESEAKEKFDKFQELIHPKFGLSMLSDLLGGIDLSGFSLNEPLPSLPDSNGNTSRQKLIERFNKNGLLTLEQLYKKVIVSRAHFNIIGSYKQVAEEMMSWFQSQACDGFNVMPPSMPGCLSDFVSGVIPELQKMGVYKKEYKKGTLRDKLGLKRPNSSYINV
ncbi:Nitrilotriacetate monooxygenase component A [Marinomonas spartinae]|uniref:LLM class flavin-dependent oxidoreductase n=1 Tax=Marinomonas spartinae TaxID=1792290 RepID=UPI0008090452|nr:LLM class flavin-dependent oxidoreductase [Marinomonas spartinae]SBS39152.1 Nitrilotriacetate monooxygenase component A [Marinomonas spartinae]